MTQRKPDRIVSACLAGVPCRYDGKSCLQRRIANWVQDGVAIPVCAEVLGGLPVPRAPCEICGGDAGDVLAGRARVIDRLGKDHTDAFVRGGWETLGICRERGIVKAWLKSRSPSCGCGILYDGSFTRTLVPGMGVAAYILQQNGVLVYAADE